MNDPVSDLSHDHADINRRVLSLAAQLRALERDGAGSEPLEDPLTNLRELLFLHFAREEEGLFPFVREVAPDLAAHVHAMEVAHDTICGALARMVHLASTAAAVATIVTMFERFEAAYSVHASKEAQLLAGLGVRLTADQRAALASLVAGL
jgi:DUF438 domain-containing protein